MRNSILLFFLLLTGFSSTLSAQQKVTFPSTDGMDVTADWYFAGEMLPIAILCHQAKWSRGEYIETAKWLNEHGYNCLAVDLRSGGEVNDIKNETHMKAEEDGNDTGYLDARQDVDAAVQYISENYPDPIILVGSSYSAGLALSVGVEYEKVVAIACFAPGDYYGDELLLKDPASMVSKPVFLTGTKEEVNGQVKEIAAHIPEGFVTVYAPKGEGHHGSRALWTSKKGHEGYREVFLAWLQGLEWAEDKFGN